MSLSNLASIETAYQAIHDDSWLLLWYNTMRTSTSSYNSRVTEQELNGEKNLEAGADGEAIDKSWLVACFPWLSQAAFLWHPGPLVWGGTRTTIWALLR